MRQAGIRLAYVSNLTPKMLTVMSQSAGISDLFEHILSTDRVKAYKPDPRAYQMAEVVFNLPRESIVFAAFGGWDAAGAKSFGLNTFWVNQVNAPLEELGVKPDAIGRTLRFGKIRHCIAACDEVNAMPAQVSGLFRYPIKGLSAEPLDSLTLQAGRGVLGDRAFALALPATVFDERNPQPLSKFEFMVLARQEALARLTTSYDGSTGLLSVIDSGERLSNGNG